MITRLVGSATYGGYDKVVGDIGTRDEIFNAFKNEAPEAFKTLVRETESWHHVSLNLTLEKNMEIILTTI